MRSITNNEALLTQLSASFTQ